MIASNPLLPVTLIDSPLHGQSFVDAEIREVFNYRSFVQRCVECEVALARAEAQVGLIPDAAAVGITRAAEAGWLDFDRLRRDTEIVGYPILPLVEQLAEAAGEAGHYLHWGATTQDIMDTASVLQIRAGIGVIEAGLERTIDALRRLASLHRDTPMAGRTHLQHALPITFGYKAAVWLSALERHCERLSQLKARVLVVELSGAAGTLASLGDRGMQVQAELARVLGLGVPAITWHSCRDGFAETVQLLALVTGSLAKIAVDISIMTMTEIGELAEPFVRHRGASSTMPQKRNPISCELIVAAAKVVRQHAGLMLDAMAHDFERATGPWHVEWAALPESFALTSGALTQASFLLSGLEVNPRRMRENLGSSRGLIVAEAVMMALAPTIGRQSAHDRVYAGCREASESGKSLFEVLASDERVTAHLGLERLRSLTDPANYLGAAGEMVDRVLDRQTSAPSRPTAQASRPAASAGASGAGAGEPGGARSSISGGADTVIGLDPIDLR